MAEKETKSAQDIAKTIAAPTKTTTAPKAVAPEPIQEVTPVAKEETPVVEKEVKEVAKEETPVVEAAKEETIVFDNLTDVENKGTLEGDAANPFLTAERNGFVDTDLKKDSLDETKVTASTEGVGNTTIDLMDGKEAANVAEAKAAFDNLQSIEVEGAINLSDSAEELLDKPNDALLALLEKRNNPNVVTAGTTFDQLLSERNGTSPQNNFAAELAKRQGN